MQPNYVDTDASIKQEKGLTDNPENVIFVCDGIKFEKIDSETVEKEETLNNLPWRKLHKSDYTCSSETLDINMVLSDKPTSPNPSESGAGPSGVNPENNFFYAMESNVS